MSQRGDRRGDSHFSPHSWHYRPNTQNVDSLTALVVESAVVGGEKVGGKVGVPHHSVLKKGRMDRSSMDTRGSTDSGMAEEMRTLRFLHSSRVLLGIFHE